MAQQSDASIGSVTELKGKGRVVRDKPYDAALSFGIKSGGCSGFQYLIKPCNQDLERGDELVKIDELKLKVDSSSILHLLGTEIDWTEDIMGNRFVFNNPNADFKCGCGSSFG